MDVEGVAEVEDITLWLAVHVIVPWVGCDYRGKGNADKTISYLIEHGCLLCLVFLSPVCPSPVCLQDLTSSYCGRSCYRHTGQHFSALVLFCSHPGQYADSMLLRHILL